MKRESIPLRLALVGGVLVLAAPVLTYASRVTTIPTLAWAYLISAAAFALGGAACFIAAPGFAIRNKQPVTWIPLFFLAMLALSVGGFILALADDPTVFLATLLSAVFSLVVTWYERAFRKLQGDSGISAMRDR